MVLFQMYPKGTYEGGAYPPYVCFDMHVEENQEHSCKHYYNLGFFLHLSKLQDVFDSLLFIT